MLQIRPDQEELEVVNKPAINRAVPLQKFSFYLMAQSGSTTTEETLSILQDRYEDFIKNFSFTDQQNTVFKRVIMKLADLKIEDIVFEYSVESEIVVSRSSAYGISMIVIDEDGDTMISCSPYASDGWREFLDIDIFDEEYSVFKLLS